MKLYMKNLIYHFPTCYDYSVKKAYRGTKFEHELNLNMFESDTGYSNFYIRYVVMFISNIIAD